MFSGWKTLQTIPYEQGERETPVRFILPYFPFPVDAPHIAAFRCSELRGRVFLYAPFKGRSQQFDQNGTLFGLELVEIALPPADGGKLCDMTYLEQGPVRFAALKADQKFTVMIRHAAD